MIAKQRFVGGYGVSFHVQKGKPPGAIKVVVPVLSLHDEHGAIRIFREVELTSAWHQLFFCVFKGVHDIVTHETSSINGLVETLLFGAIVNIQVTMGTVSAVEQFHLLAGKETEGAIYDPACEEI